MFKRVFFLFILIFYINLDVYAGWYGGHLVSYNSSSRIGDCGSSQCETTPHTTECSGDGINSDTRSAVELNNSSTPYFADDPSDNDNHEGDSESNVASSGDMTCFYWDNIKFHKSTYKLDDTYFDSFGVADGTELNFNINFQLKILIDGTESDINIDDGNNGIKTINFELKFLDNTVLNQFDNSGGSAIFPISTDSDSIDGSNIRTITYNIDSSNIGNFTKYGNKFIFKYIFYNSTTGDYRNIEDNFILQQIKYDISFQGGASYNGEYIYSAKNNNEINAVNEVIKVEPLYKTNIGGELSPSGNGLVEGNVQSGSLDITRNSSSGNNPSIDGLYFLQTGSTSDYFIGSGIIDNSNNSNPNIYIGTNNYGTKIKQFAVDTVSYILKTLFTLKDNGGTLDQIKDLRVYQYIKYTLDSKVVIYLAGVLNDNNTQSFETLKIYGKTNISNKKQKDLLANQDKLDIQNLAGNITKASLKRDIKKRAINAIKFVDTERIAVPVDNITLNAWNSTNGGKILGDILYYEFTDGTNAKIGDGNELYITGRKTLIVRGGNLRITQNIINDPNSDGNILGIIVLKDKNGFGGKVYIDSSVDEVDAVIYADKSIIGYNDIYDNGDSDSIIKHEIDGNINNNILDNQLYIYGSVFSENTIGASRLDPPVCPFWTTIQGITCNTIEAQKYDFNYLRTGLGTSPKYSGDPNTGKNYPVVIKYNSFIQSTPPPLFGN